MYLDEIQVDDHEPCSGLNRLCRREPKNPSDMTNNPDEPYCLTDETPPEGPNESRDMFPFELPQTPSRPIPASGTRSPLIAKE